MGHTPRYIPGDYLMVCDRTGYVIRASEAKKEWTGHIVRSQSWETRHAQDFVRGIPDNQTVPEARPDSDIEQTLGALSTTINSTLPQEAGDTSITVVSTTGILAGHSLHIVLDSGNVQFCVVLSITSATVLVLTTATKLQGRSSAGNAVIDLSAVTAVTL